MSVAPSILPDTAQARNHYAFYTSVVEGASCLRPLVVDLGSFQVHSWTWLGIPLVGRSFGLHALGHSRVSTSRRLSTGSWILVSAFPFRLPAFVLLREFCLQVQSDTQTVGWSFLPEPSTKGI